MPADVKTLIEETEAAGDPLEQALRAATLAAAMESDPFAPEAFKLIERAKAADDGLSRFRVADVRRFMESLPMLAKAVADGGIKASEFADLKRYANGAFEAVWDSHVQGPHTRGKWESLPEWVQLISLSSPQMHTLAGLRKRVAKIADGGAVQVAMLEAIDEFMPVAAALADLRDKIIKRPPPVSPEERRLQASIPKTPRSQVVYDVVKAVIEEKRPAMVAEYEKDVVDIVESLRNRHGPSLYPPQLRKPTQQEADARERDMQRYAFVSRFLAEQGKDRESPRTINAALLRAGADLHVDETFQAVVAKILDKAGEMESPKVQSLTGFDFNLTGMLKGKSVRIEQTITYNRSVLGKPFVQFPARIYVDGKFQSEAQFKTFMVGAEAR